MNTTDEQGDKYVKVVSRIEPGFLSRLIKTVFFTEILQGMKLTLTTAFKKPVTKQYPKEKRQARSGFRGMHALVRDPATGKAKCVGCGLCAAVCPSRCINIYTSEGPNHEKVVDRYELDILRCLYCSLCVEACPFGAVVMTEHYEYSDYSKDSFFLTIPTLLDNWDKYMEGAKGTFYLDNFWRPKTKDFATPQEQAVFRPRGASEPTSPAVPSKVSAPSLPPGNTVDEPSAGESQDKGA
ncbi:NuoI/complex I 23 kDa subunit family protein [Candidatus Magnetobacterium casense]|uniref:NuoI/complex I 23 kDa subunit family protein n=1 Tax=Candidatus Magnetobacterium casense TaxID=1455061 RepID=UPI00190F3CCB|nr:NADH-quinone oxidoreductase subunit I [Candidatus Magnetobacterium casensis]